MPDRLPSTRWKKFGMKLLLLAASSLFCLAILEGALLVRAGHERKASGPPREGWFFAPVGFKIEPDLIAGYRQSPGKFRFAGVHQGELLYDDCFITNAQGYVSSHDFTRTKAAGKKRVAVMGDSFTAQWHADVPWPEELERRLNQSATGSYEFYNFAVSGGGLQNWHSIFFKELVPTYEFDAVVFAVWGDDLARTFCMGSTKDGGFFTLRFPVPPRSLAEFHAAFFPKMFRWAAIVGDEQLSRTIAERDRWEWPGLKIRTGEGIASIVKGIKSRMETQPELDVFTDAAPPLARGDLESYYAKIFKDANEPVDGKEAIGRLYLMMDYCKAKNLPVVLCNIPTREAAMEFSRRRKQGSNLSQRQLQSVARDYGCLYFDGHEVFGDLSPEAIRDEYWLKHDMHWRRRGSDLFAARLAEFLERHWQKDGVREASADEK